jgi:hypothetical protein
MAAAAVVTMKSRARLCSSSSRNFTEPAECATSFSGRARADSSTAEVNRGLRHPVMTTSNSQICRASSSLLQSRSSGLKRTKEASWRSRASLSAEKSFRYSEGGGTTSTAGPGEPLPDGLRTKALTSQFHGGKPVL